MQYFEESKKRNKGIASALEVEDANLPNLVDMEMIAEFFVAKNLQNDKDSAIKQIVKALKLLERGGKLNRDHFLKIFVVSIVKDSIVEVISDIEDIIKKKVRQRAERS